MGSEFNMNPRYTLSASLLLAVAQASSLYPASTFPLESFDRLMALSRNERTLYSGFEPPMSYEADIDVVASARSLNCKSGWTTSASRKFCYQYFPITDTVKGWTWDQARRECKKAAYTAGQSRTRGITMWLKISLNLRLRMFGLEQNSPKVSYRTKPLTTLRPGGLHWLDILDGGWE